MTISVAIVVLNWNAGNLLIPCLKSIFSQTYSDFQLWVVDNGSTDGSFERAQKRFPQATFAQNGDNIGFAAGNNRALAQINADVIILVNPDTVMEADWLDNLLAALELDATIGVAGCKIFYPDGKLQHVGGILSPEQGMPAYIGQYEADVGQHDQVRDCDYLMGSAFAIRREMMAEIGLLDEGYFLYFEEADYCARARQAGWRTVVAPAARLTHVESATRPQRDLLYLQRFHLSRWRYLLKHTLVGDLLDVTLPAEKKWLSSRRLVERKAVGAAYLETILRLPAIRVARLRDGGSDWNSKQMQAICDCLRTLHCQELQLRDEQTDWLTNHWQIDEPPFRSKLPLVGGAIAKFREKWLDIAVRWYIRPQLQRQNQFNEVAANQIASLHSRLAILQEDQAILAQSLGECRQQLTDIA